MLERKTMIPLDQLIKLKDDPESGLCFERRSIQVALHPRFLSNLNFGALHYFNSRINTYVPSLDGILAGFGTIYLREPFGHFLNEETHVHLHIFSDFWIFRPSIGGILKGLVNKKSSGHVSVLIHGCFNVPCFKPSAGNEKDNQETQSTWIGSNLKVGQTVRIKVQSIDLSQTIPQIVGDLHSAVDVRKEESDDDFASTQQVCVQTFEEFERHQNASPGSGIVTSKKTTGNESVVKKKSKRKRADEDILFIKEEVRGSSMSESEMSTVSERSGPPSAKKARVKTEATNSGSVNEAETSMKDSLLLEISSQSSTSAKKTKRKKKRKEKTKDIDTLSESIVESESIKTEIEGSDIRSQQTPSSSLTSPSTTTETVKSELAPSSPQTSKQADNLIRNMLNQVYSSGGAFVNSPLKKSRLKVPSIDESPSVKNKKDKKKKSKKNHDDNTNWSDHTMVKAE